MMNQSAMAEQQQRKKLLLLFIVLLLWHQQFEMDTMQLDQDVIEQIVVLKALYVMRSKQRAKKWKQARFDFFSQAAKLRHRNKFSRMYRMSYDAFVHLIEVLSPILEEGHHYWKAGENRIQPEIIIALGIRWLSGGSYHDISESLHISNASFYRCLRLFLDAILKCDEFKIKFPSGEAECRNQALKFRSLSSEDVMRGCVGALDGCFIRMRAPRACYANNVFKYYSGHYEDYGLNVQASCNHRCQFNFVAVAAPGSCADMRALRKTSLPTQLENIPFTYYVVADAAYALSEKILVPFTGSQRHDAYKDAFNYFLSQLRIRIEQSFGLLIGKWRILRPPLECSLPNCSDIIIACCKLHNYVIEYDWDDTGSVDLNAIEPIGGAPIAGLGYLPNIDEPIYENMDPISENEAPGRASMRNAVLAYVRRNDLRRRQF